MITLAKAGGFFLTLLFYTPTGDAYLLEGFEPLWFPTEEICLTRAEKLNDYVEHVNAMYVADKTDDMPPPPKYRIHCLDDEWSPP